VSSVDLDAGLEAIVAATITRRYLDRVAPDLLAEVQRQSPDARQWQTHHDEKVRHTHAQADGQTIPANLRFILDKPQRGPTGRGQAEHAGHEAEGHHGGRTGNAAAKAGQAGTEQARWPRDENLSPGNKINCRCSAITIIGLIAATMEVTDVEVAGPAAKFEVSSRFPRLAESEFGDGQDPGLHFMARALDEFAGRLGIG
jgi:hypothetical protein